jgi:eukaryotic-like serine/threonine-protein kinase
MLGLASSRPKNHITARALRGEVDAILAKAMRREPAKRYATADALAQDLVRHLNGQTVAAQPEHWATSLHKVLRRHRLAFAAGGAVALAVLSGAGISVMQARRANEAAERARVVKEFVVDVFKLNAADNSSNAELRKLPAELLLDHGARLIQSRFAGQTAIQAELYGVVAGIFIDLSAPASAVEYATRQVVALAASKAKRVEHAAAHLLLARALNANEQLQDAEAHARRALTLASEEMASGLQTEPATAITARMLLARVLWGLGRMPESEKELTLVEAALAAPPYRADVLRADALTLRANFLQLATLIDEAVQLLDKAVTEALAAEGPLSLTAVTIRLTLADRLSARQRFEESDAARQAALTSLRALGGAHEIRAALHESFLARQQLMMGQTGFTQAQAVIERLRTAAGGERPFPQTVRAWLDLDLGASLLIWGDVASAARLILPASGVLRPAANSPRVLWRIAVQQGDVAMQLGHHDEADNALRERLAARVAQGHGQVNFAAFDYAYIALNLGMAGRHEEALAFLDSAPTIGAQGGDAAQSYAQVLVNARARLKLDAGDARAALALIPPGEGNPSNQFLMVDDDRLIRGEARCTLGQHRAGLTQLQAAINDYAPRSHPHHPRLARAWAVAGLCALATGQRPLAQTMAQNANAAFVGQPDVSPYFKQPASHLAALLGAQTRRAP